MNLTCGLSQLQLNDRMPLTRCLKLLMLLEMRSLSQGAIRSGWNLARVFYSFVEIHLVAVSSLGRNREHLSSLLIRCYGLCICESIIHRLKAHF